MDEKYLEYSDLLLVPNFSFFRHRSEIDLSVRYFSLYLRTPIFAAPMDSISSKEFIIQMSNAGGLAFVQRFDSFENRTNIITELYKETKNINFGVSVGLLDSISEKVLVEHALDSGASVICLDVANGHNYHTVKYTQQIKNLIVSRNSNCLVMSGNVASVIGFKLLESNGADLIRVGIGSGSVCTTRNMTGVGVPQATLIRNIAKENNSAFIIADGGIKYPGDIVKALALGADGVMTGYLLSGAKECPNHIYRGMASRSSQEDQFGFVRSVEGIEIEAKNNQVPLQQIMSEICDNIKSGMSYLGSNRIGDIHTKANFVKVTRGAIKEL